MMPTMPKQFKLVLNSLANPQRRRDKKVTLKKIS